MHPRWLFPCILVAGGCGEGTGTPPREPVSPAIVIPTSTSTPTSTATATATSTATSTSTSTPTATATATATPSPSPTDLPAVGHLETPFRLSHLFATLAALDDGRAHDDVRILQYGDSHTAADLGAGAFRRVLQTRFGDGGRGFVSIGEPWIHYGQDGVHGGMSKTFDVARTHSREGRSPGDGCYGLLGVGICAREAGARAWTDVAPRSSRVEIDYWQEPAAGSFDVLIDGTRAGRIKARAPQPGSGFYAVDVPEARHEVEIRAVGDGEVRVFGMALDRRRVGVVVDALGINGAQVFTPLRWSEDHFAEQLRHRAPELVVLAYGTNESLEPRLGDDDYERGLVDLLGRIARATPSASCLLLGPPDAARRTGGGGAWAPWSRVQEIASIQRRVAQAAGCAFYDQQAAMGGPGTIMAWASEPEPRATRDRIHLTRTGYAQLGTSFAADLLGAYDEWRASEGLPPSSAPKTWDVASR